MRYIILFFLFFSVAAQSQQNAWNYLNFESGGFVTEIIPVKYTGALPQSINNQVLYARTDIGGVYRSSDNGQSWTSINSYYRTSNGNSGLEVSGLSIQGMAVKDNGDETETVIIATGFYREDMNPTSCIFRSTNSGQSWTNPSNSSIDAPGILFQGNNFPVKIGGPCITYSCDPNHPNWLYAGGMNPNPSTYSDTKPYLYKSLDNGQTWINSLSALEAFHNQTENGECIICISINPENSDNIWVGTTHRIIFTTNAGANWQTRSIGSETTPYVKRILLQGDGNSITGAMVTWGNWGQTGIGRFMENNSWNYEPLNEQFYFEHNGTRSGMFSALAYVEESENLKMIIAGRYELPLRKTTNFGSNWFGENNHAGSDEIVFQYDQNINNFPAHQQRTELNPDYGYMYDGQSCLTKNPNTGWGSHWYLSGGAGARMTVSGTSNNSFSGSTWKYTAIGQSMTVNYDVAFNTVTQNDYPNGRNAIYLPLSDWTMGWTYTDRLHQNGSNWLIPDTLSYDRQETKPSHLFDTYISNVIRVLFNQNNPNVSYCIGGSVYDFGVSGDYGLENRRAGFYKREINSSHWEITYTPRRDNHNFLKDTNRAIVDGILIPSGENGRIVVLVGRNSGAASPNLASTGIFYSDDEGLNWNQGDFTVQGDAGRTTADEYNNSILPSLGSGPNGTISGLFGGHFTLASAGNGFIYLWLESKVENNNSTGGGLFISTNNGANWRAGANPSSSEYLGPGSLKYLGGNEIALAFRDARTSGQNGMYKGAINTSDGGISWSAFGVTESDNFLSAEHLDYQAPGVWAVYGKRTEGENNQIYRSTDNGANWTRIPESPETLPYFPKVNSLRIRPAPYNNELWVATSGQGVYIYKNFQKNCLPDITSHFVIQDQPYTYDCDNDIVVSDGGFLEIRNCSSFKMASGKSIKVEAGGKLVCDNVTFDCLNSGQFDGIELNNYVDSCKISNCTFNNASTAISIVNIIDTTVVLVFPYIEPVISNNTFNITGNQSKGISGINVYKLILQENTFINTGSQYPSVEFENNIPEHFFGTSLVNNITGNTFNYGLIQLSLSGFTSELANYYIFDNTFQYSTGVCLLGRMITGSIENNTFQSNADINTIYLIQSNLYLDSNNVNNSGNGLCLSSIASYLIFAPIKDGNGELIWYGGLNTFNSSDSCNIYVRSGNPITDYGMNSFTIGKQSYFHIFGQVEDSLGDTYYCRENYWYGYNGTPHIHLWNYVSSDLIIIYDDNVPCCPQQNMYNGYFISQKSNNVYDTIFTSVDNTGTQVTADEISFSGGLKDKELGLYSGAVSKFKNIINNYPVSKYLNGSMMDLYSCYERMDTVDNNNRIAIFTELKNYISQKLQQYQSNAAFTDVAYNLLLMAKVKIGELSTAADGYEFLSLNHPEPERRLLASMDYECVLDMMGNGGGVKENDETFAVTDEAFAMIEKNVEKFILKDTLAGISKKNYDAERNKIKRGNETNKYKIDAAKEKKFDDKVKYNMVNTRSLTKVQKDKNRMECLMLLAGVNQKETKDKGTVLPTRYSLLQNYPNPFNPITKIKYELPNDVNVNIVVYDILGREITKLVNNEFKRAGNYLVEFNGSGFASGVYFYRIVAGNFVDVKKMVLVK